MYEWIPDAVEQAKEVGKKYSFQWEFFFSDPASPEEILVCEEALGVSLPPSYRAFLLQHNGARLFIEDYQGVLLYNTQQLVTTTLEERNLCRDFLEEELLNFILIGASEAHCDYLGIDPEQKLGEEYAMIDCVRDEAPNAWINKVVAPSFEHWLKWTFNAVIQQENVIEYWWNGFPKAWTGDDPPLGDSLSTLSGSNDIELEERLRQDYLAKCEGDDQQEVVEICGKLINLGNSGLYWYIFRARAQIKLGRFQEALQDYDMQLNVHPASMMPRIDRAMLREQLGDKQGAIDDYTYSLKNWFWNAYQRKGIHTGTYGTPYFYPLICFKRGVLRAELGDLIGSKEDFQEAARTYQLENLPDEANQTLEKMKELNLLDP